MAFPTSRETTYAAGSQVKSADLNKIQDRIVGLEPLVVADITVTADNTTETLTAGSPHGRETGEGPYRLTTTGTIPTGLSTSTDYWLISPSGPGGTTLRLATSLANALAGTVVAFSTNGTGTLKVVDTATTTRPYDETVYRDLTVDGSIITPVFIAQNPGAVTVTGSLQVDSTSLFQAAVSVAAALLITTTGGYLKGAGARAAAPSTGTHVVGEIVFNADPVASGKIGWVCVTAGSPGTWKAFGAIDA